MDPPANKSKRIVVQREGRAVRFEIPSSLSKGGRMSAIVFALRENPIVILFCLLSDDVITSPDSYLRCRA